MMMLDLLEAHLLGDDTRFTVEELLAGIAFARGRGDPPAWWAETAFEMRAERREDREEASIEGSV